MRTTEDIRARLGRRAACFFRSVRPASLGIGTLIAGLVTVLTPAILPASPVEKQTDSPTTAATLWVLSIGVSDYGNPALNLGFAEADARAVAAALEEQKGRRVYGNVESRVLVNAEVSRESILSGIREFIAQAGDGDVATIFMAGHGVRDLLTGTYYFLPHGATPEDFFTRGLRIEELNDMVRILQRHVRHVVVILDTCHAGAADLSGTQMVRADDFAARLRAEGVFLLAATRPGDKSKEIARLGHGVFTYVLLNALRGEANAGLDGLLSLAELVLYLGTEVPRLTGGEQTPYYLIAGSDLPFADVRQPNSIVVLPFRNQDPHDTASDWMRTALQESFHFALGRIPVISVCSLPSGDGDGLSGRAWAQRLGCGRFVTGSFVVDGDEVELHARVVDAESDADEVRASVRGRRQDFASLRQRLVRDVIARIPTVRSYRLMLEAQGVVPAEEEPEEENERSDTDDRESRWVPRWPWVSAAYAEETSPTQTPEAVQASVRNLLDAFRLAHEAKQIDSIAALWDGFSPKQRDAMRRYLDDAGDLTMQMTDVAIEPHGDEATVAYTRIDSFVDRESGKPVRIEVRQRMILIHRDLGWKIARIEAR